MREGVGQKKVWEAVWALGCGVESPAEGKLSQCSPQVWESGVGRGRGQCGQGAALRNEEKVTYIQSLLGWKC